MSNCKKNKTPISNNAKTKKGDINQIINTGDINQIINTDDNNNITIKYNLFPFGKNPIEIIIIKVHLDPVKIDHHNVGYTDEHSGYGIIFDGKEKVIKTFSYLPVPTS